MDKAIHDTANLKAEISGGIHKSRVHDSAHKHVAGTAEYIDDMPEPAGLLHAGVGLSDRPHAKIVAMDLSKVEAAPGVVCVLTGKDVPGVNDISSGGHHDEPLFADQIVEYHGQLIFAVIAETRHQARAAAKLAEITYEDLPFWTSVRDALAHDAPDVITPLRLQRGDAKSALETAKNRITAEMEIGGQEHFYLEGQIALAIPGEDDEVAVWSSTQHPSEIQHIVGHVLDIPSNAVTVYQRRMGGGFG
ncbi:MAG: molybdopterin cofactor-binding domain-containing protein, partial [Martelella sp.]